VNKFFRYFFPLFFLSCFSAFFFLRFLGQTPLRSWDEAWYAEIAKNILKTGNWFLLQWNGLPYFDHPPLAFWLMAFSFKILGVNEFATRLPSALAGIGSVFLIFLLGRKLFNQKTGFWSGIILTTVPWFWLRSREGNLDIVLVFFMILSIWLAEKTKDNLKAFFFLPIAFGFALLTKTVIAFGLLPVIVFVLLKSKVIIPKKYLLFTFFCLLFTVLPWYLTNYRAYGLTFLDRNIFVTGLKLPGYKALFSGESFNRTFNLKNTFVQIQNGISLWYKPFLVTFFLSVFFIRCQSVFVLYLWLVPFLSIFSLSAKAELWHLIILYPSIALLIASFLSLSADSFIEQIYSFFNKSGKKYFSKSILASFYFLVVSVFIFWNSSRIIKGLYKDIVKTNPVNDEIILAKAAGVNNEVIYIDDDYWPAAVFYSGRKVYSIPHSTDTNIKNVKQLFSEAQKPFQLLTKQWILERDNISTASYKVLNRIGDRVLIKSTNSDL